MANYGSTHAQRRQVVAYASFHVILKSFSWGEMTFKYWASRPEAGTKPTQHTWKCHVHAQNDLSCVLCSTLNSPPRG